ncbi:MAG: YlxR family protein [Actinomycetota bacterium]
MLSGSVRTCVGCRRAEVPTSGWSRIAAGPDGGIATGRKAPGRGAWVCSAGCFETAAARGRLGRALRRTVTNTQVAALRATLFLGNDEMKD